METAINELVEKLKEVPDAYNAFIAAVVTYVRKKPERYEKVMQFIEESRTCSSGDILRFITDQPDFNEDGIHVDCAYNLSDDDRPAFGLIRCMLDRTVRIQICMHEAGEYWDYKNIGEVPHVYDEMKVFGIGLVQSEYGGWRSKHAKCHDRYKFAIEIRLVDSYFAIGK